MKWYAVHTYSGQEGKVKQHLDALVERNGLSGIGQVLVPQREVTTIQKGKKTVRDQKVFPSYILIEMELNKDTMHVVTDVPGVTHFVGVDNKPQALRKAEVDRILGQEAPVVQESKVIEIPFHNGDKIRIKDGPFKDFDGVVEEIHPEKGKLKVMVSVFGRSTPVELDFNQVDAV